MTIRGFSSSGEKILSQGSINIKISSDPIGGVIFYRDVPLMPTEGQDGKIEPLAEALIGLIDWRLKDISRPDSKVVLRDMPTCANCHSFSAGGKTLGMDVDGPTGDKGAYAVADIRKEMTISPREIMTWNSWQDKARTGKTIGFLSQISPDGQFVLSTVNESLYVVNFAQYDFLQVFYPTRGIIACYDRTTGTIKPLPGANDPAMVQCSPVWSPDGKWVVFSRAAARDPFPPGQKMPQRANDPDELPMRYDLYKVPFNQGAGGQAQPIAGACDNGMSNTFPKISPDGKWIVFVKCRNGQLMRPDSELWIVPLVGGQARRMRCNMSLMNSWHSFSPNGRWMVFSSKSRSPYTQMFLTHIDKNGMDSPPVRVTGATAANRAVNIPEFVQVKYADLDSITIPSLEYWRQYKRGLDLAQRDRHADAVECFRRALAVDPGSARIQASLADSLTAISQLGEAVEYYDRAVAGEPQNFVYLSNRGNALLYLGQLDRALADFDTSISIRPGYAVAHANRGSVLARRQEYGQAMAAFSESLRLKPDQYWVWCNRGILKEMVDDDKGAAEDLIKCLDLAPPEWPQRADVQRRLQELRVRVGSK
ncbi:MAG: tetratricopeptide repeat protein [Planctomycetaceae bacterium]|nr:tetratricopeptide repeat protein [Planctomycetaceae bacterium]